MRRTLAYMLRNEFLFQIRVFLFYVQPNFLTEVSDDEDEVVYAHFNELINDKRNDGFSCDRD